MPSLDLGKLNKILKGQRGEENLITALRKVRAKYGYVPPEAIALIAKALNVAQSRVYSVATFYEEFRTQPVVEPVAKQELKPVVNERILTEKSVVLGNIGGINPEDIDSYISAGGYDALNKTLASISPEETARLIVNSGLRERDSGSPVGDRWLSLAAASAEKKYVVGYASDEEPGISINELLLAGDPHSLVEGMMITAYAVGASQCYLYIPSEFTLALRRVELALKQARERGFLGSKPKSTSLSLNIEVRDGPRFPSCEPELAVISFIEGNRAIPGVSPPSPQDRGLWGKPTFVGSTETFYSIPWIIREGADAFSQYGTEDSRGTKVLTLSGELAHTGIAEVPMGMSLRQLVFNIGGGIKPGHKFKAAHLGGPSGGCLPAELLDTPLDYHSLAELGLDFGSGSVLVLGEDACMVDIAKFFINFTYEHYCGACAPGRLGVKQALDILTRISQGEGREEDIRHLEQIGSLMKEASLCAMCRVASNPVMTALHYFGEEYEAHIQEKRCPAGVCPMSQA
jgi:NADH-quinone oxidoreductase subunit F